jgi:hypothetical protein
MHIKFRLEDLMGREHFGDLNVEELAQDMAHWCILSWRFWICIFCKSQVQWNSWNRYRLWRWILNHRLISIVFNYWQQWNSKTNAIFYWQCKVLCHETLCPSSSTLNGPSMWSMSSAIQNSVYKYAITCWLLPKEYFVFPLQSTEASI